MAFVSAKILPCSNLFLPFPFATCLRHACLLYPRPAFDPLQALHSPRATLQPSSRVPIVSVRRLVRLFLAFTRFCHSCLPDTWLLFVLDSPPWADKCHTQGVRLCPACAGASGTHVCSARYLQPPPFLPRVSARHLLYPSLAFHARCPTLGASFSCLHALMPSLSWFPHLGQINATRCEAVSSLPLSSYKPCTPHALLCSPHGACQSCLSDAWCVFLLPSRAYAIRVCPTLSCSLSWIPHLGRRNATKCEAVCSLCRCF